jgi:hypothetical protein
MRSMHQNYTFEFSKKGSEPELSRQHENNQKDVMERRTGTCIQRDSAMRLHFEEVRRSHAVQSFKFVAYIEIPLHARCSRTIHSNYSPKHFVISPRDQETSLVESFRGPLYCFCKPIDYI